MNGILHKSSKIWEDKEGVVVSWKSRKKGMTPMIQYYRETTEDKEWRPRSYPPYEEKFSEAFREWKTNYSVLKSLRGIMGRILCL